MKDPLKSEEADELAKRLKKGDKRAFDLFYGQYSERLYGFAFSLLKNHEDAKEIVQETFLKLWKKREQINPEQSVKAFLFSISYNISIDLIRKRLKDERYRDYLKYQFLFNEPCTENQAGYNELNHELQKIIDELPEQRKKIYKMSREDGLAHNEIAEKLNITAKTVENHINLALKTIRKKLGPDNFLCLLFICLFI